jgi:EpsI family protein
LLTTTENRLADDNEWRLAERGRAEFSLGSEKIAVTSAQIVSGPYRRLVWSFYVVDGMITASLFEAKLLQARAVLLRQAPVAALVAVSASMDDPRDPAEAQLARFLAASQSLPRYLDALRGKAEPGV